MALSSLKTQKRGKTQQTPALGNDSEDSDARSTASEGNAGWADSIARVLSTTKPKTKKSIVLSRAKKFKPTDKVKEEKKYDFEVEGEIKEQKPDTDLLTEQIKQRKNVPLQLRVKPTWKDLDRERTLRKVATKGVVQLFNAVRIHQKELQQQLEEAGPLDSRRDAVLNNISKRKFLDVLMSGNRAKSEAIDNPVKDEHLKQDSSDENDEAASPSKKKSEWNVLKSDFMTNKKIKHWDEEDDSDTNQGQSSADDSEDDA